MYYIFIYYIYVYKTNNIIGEHGSSALPHPYSFTKNDEKFINMHWGIDLGSEDLTKELSQSLGCGAMIAKVSRLFVDLNRPLNSTTLFRDIADNKPVDLNLSITEEEKNKRLNLVYHPFHNALSETIKEITNNNNNSLKVLLSIHSFTDNYEGKKRSLEIGVLYDDDNDYNLAKNLCEYLKATKDNYKVDLNLPWSGKDGYMYSVQKHSKPTNNNNNSIIKPLMIEARQDLLINPEWRKQLVNHLSLFFKEKRHHQ